MSFQQDDTRISMSAPFRRNVRGLVCEASQDDGFRRVSNLRPNGFPEIKTFLSRNPIELQSTVSNNELHRARPYQFEKGIRSRFLMRSPAIVPLSSHSSSRGIFVTIRWSTLKTIRLSAVEGENSNKSNMARGQCPSSPQTVRVRTTTHSSANAVKQELTDQSATTYFCL